MTKTVDLRSDTVTQPTGGMRSAMAGAVVGDAVYGEDPTVRALEERVAKLLGKQAALFVPSGTMANQLALLLHTERGDEVVIAEDSHVALYEAGAGAALSGVQFVVAGKGGAFERAQFERAVKPREPRYPHTALLWIENTHTRSGGRVFPFDTLCSVTRRAAELGIRRHLDGARLWNASVASGQPLNVLAQPFDTASVCFSKGLGAPVGSALALPEALVARAVRLRQRLGGGMRQAGVLAAAALYALEHQFERLANDHDSARELAQGLSRAEGLQVDLQGVETNIVNVQLRGSYAKPLTERLAQKGVLVSALSDSEIRLVTHLGVQRHDVGLATELLLEVSDVLYREALDRGLDRESMAGA